MVRSPEPPRLRAWNGLCHVEVSEASPVLHAARRGGGSDVKERLQKVLSAAGVASRRRAEEIIAAGEVTVNGRVARLGELVDLPSDVILVRGQPISAETTRVYLALNKPRGIVTSLRSTHGERTIMELVDVGARVYPVGRLDKETSGLLLLTDDGDWANHVTHPRYGVEKEYRALLQGRPGEEALRQLREGVRLPDGTVTAAARVVRLRDEGSGTWLTITVTEGKKRQIRLMAEAIRHPIIELQRVRIGAIRLGGLPEGQWRRLSDEEVESIYAGGSERALSGRT